VWDTYVTRRDALGESRELRGYAKTTQVYDWDTCRPGLEIFDAPCNEHTLAIVEFQAWRWDLAARYLAIHVRNRPAEDDILGWWAWYGTVQRFRRELFAATNLKPQTGVTYPVAKSLDRPNQLLATWAEQSGLRVVVEGGTNLRVDHGACKPRFAQLAAQVQNPTVASFRAFAASNPCHPGRFAWNDPRRGANGVGEWVTVLGFPAFKQYARAYAEAHLELRSFPDVIMDGMLAWFDVMSPYVAQGVLDVTPEEWAKLRAKAAKMRSANTAYNASSAVLALAAAVGPINALAGALVGLFGLLLYGVGKLLEKFGAVGGGHLCPMPPFDRTLSSRGCDTSRVFNNSGLVDTLMNMDALTPDFTLVPPQYRPDPPADPSPLYVTPPAPQVWDLPDVGKSPPSKVPQVLAGIAAAGALALILRKATT